MYALFLYTAQALRIPAQLIPDWRPAILQIKFGREICSVAILTIWLIRLTVPHGIGYAWSEWLASC